MAKLYVTTKYGVLHKFYCEKSEKSKIPFLVLLQSFLNKVKLQEKRVEEHDT
ncbi:hypothetical protein [Bacillus thuringiensis]|uniref:hypothetical protein n=1 Tax=Bacillus thuringiensis TaxID=1428 RepID=UPI002DB68CB2|nr:hypothetical protein [Bacillus cereus]